MSAGDRPALEAIELAQPQDQLVPSGSMVAAM
jgi:hypothetical protein